MVIFTDWVFPHDDHSFEESAFRRNLQYRRKVRMKDFPTVGLHGQVVQSTQCGPGIRHLNDIWFYIVPMILVTCKGLQL